MYTRAILSNTRRVAAQQSVRNTGFIPGPIRGPMLALTPILVIAAVTAQMNHDMGGTKPSGVSYTQF